MSLGTIEGVFSAILPKDFELVYVSWVEVLQVQDANHLELSEQLRQAFCETVNLLDRAD